MPMTLRLSSADEAFDLIAGVADGTIRDVRAIAERLASWRTT
jgi:hypothetical protein